MDKVHALLAVLKKQHFWVLCALILIASTVVWMMAVGNIEAEAQQNQQRIQTALQDAKQVASVSQHPNDQITAAYNQQTAKLKQDVFVVWNSLYKKQRDTVLKWPPALGEDFIKHVDNTPFLGEIPVDFREIYANYVKARWAEIPKIIKARAVSAEDAAGNRGRAKSTRRAIPDYHVIWTDQERIRKELFSTPRPTTEWVWLTQEDLWIYENLLNVIKKTNEGTIGPHNAVISTIDSMDVGKTAAQDAGGKGRIGLTGGEAGDAASGGSSSSGSPAGLLNGRYVDATGIPLENGITARDDEYKRIPVRLALQMDAREIPLLILNCANAPLPVEVQQVGVNVNSDKSSAVKSPDLSAEDRAAGRKTPHVEVSLQGVIYIFNPPNREKLKLPPEEDSSGTAVEAFATEGATETPTPTFDDEPTVDGVPTAADATADPLATTPAAGTAAAGTAAAGTAAAPATAAAPSAGIEATEAPADITPAETAPAPAGTAPPAETSKGTDLESLFEEDTPETTPANP